MCKRFISLLLVAALMVSLTACSQITKKGDTSNDVISPEIKGGQPEINILYYAAKGFILEKDSFLDYTSKFEKQYGVKVNLKAIGDGSGTANDLENFEKKVNTYLYAQKGPELIFGNDWQSNITKLINQSTVVDVRDKIPNLKKIYDTLLGQEVFYIPIGIDYSGMVLNKKVLEEMGIKELGTDWAWKDYIELRKKWLTYSKRYFTANEYYNIREEYLRQCRLYDTQNKKATINTLEVKNAIKSIRDEIYNNFKLNDDYTYENYYNMFYVPTSKEAISEEELRSTVEYKQESLRAVGFGNISSRLYTRQIQDALDNGLVLMPDFKGLDTGLHSCGFLVNKNGNNLELAYEFVNGLLEDETQMEMWQLDRLYQYYPVNKEIEERIRNAEIQENLEVTGQKNLDKEVTDIKENALNRIKQGHAYLFVLKNMDNTAMGEEFQLYERFKKQVTKMIFADIPYSDDELERELKKLEAEYTIWLNE
jgi:hypothetical protein